MSTALLRLDVLCANLFFLIVKRQETVAVEAMLLLRLLLLLLALLLLTRYRKSAAEPRAVEKPENSTPNGIAATRRSTKARTGHCNSQPIGPMQLLTALEPG